MTITLTRTMSNVLQADDTTAPRRANARLAPRGPEPAGGQDVRLARSLRAGDALRWQRILDRLDPGKRCGAWSPVTFAGRPVVCTRAPHDAREQHSDTETGWRWYGEKS